MNVVVIIPTGLGCEIGGHNGDATPVVKLFGGLCDHVVTHPNAVNGSDINEMPDNCLYVEGSMLNRFLAGEYRLRRPARNRVLVATNGPVKPEVVNSVSAARATIGMDAKIIELATPLVMEGGIDGDRRATGKVSGWRELVQQIQAETFDALAITSPISVDRDTKLHYYQHGGVNPFGYVEAMASRLIASELNAPVAHSPVEDDLEFSKSFNEVVDPRIAAEMVSVSFLHCILKGLHRAPRPHYSIGLSVDEIDFLISPYGCSGKPHQLCRERGIPIIVVKENRCLEQCAVSDALVVENYWEAAGVVASHGAGVSPAAVRRPLHYTAVRRAAQYEKVSDE